jgi:precorrin-3B methylase
MPLNHRLVFLSARIMSGVLRQRSHNAAVFFLIKTASNKADEGADVTYGDVQEVKDMNTATIKGKKGTFIETKETITDIRTRIRIRPFLHTVLSHC